MHMIVVEEKNVHALLYKRVLIRVKLTVVLPNDDYKWSKIYEVRIVDVSPSGKYVKFEGEICGWEPIDKWQFLEVLG